MLCVCVCVCVCGQVLAKFNPKGRNAHTWTVMYTTAAEAGTGRKTKAKTLKDYSVTDGTLVCVRDLRDGGKPNDDFMRFEDECAKQGCAWLWDWVACLLCLPGVSLVGRMREWGSAWSDSTKSMPSLERPACC